MPFCFCLRKGNIAPGGELKTIEDYISLGVPRDIAEMKHPLENAWSFWYFRNDKNCSWEENQINLATVDTIEDFWQVYNYVEPASKLGVGCDYALFKVRIVSRFLTPTVVASERDNARLGGLPEQVGRKVDH